MLFDERNLYITEPDMLRLEGILSSFMPKNENEKNNIELLKKYLDHFNVVTPEEIPNDVVTMNTKLHLKDVDTGEILIFTLVFPSAADISKNRISVLAPIGSAVLGCRTGEVVVWKVPSRIRKLKIEKVLYQPEAAGIFY